MHLNVQHHVFIYLISLNKQLKTDNPQHITQI